MIWWTGKGFAMALLVALIIVSASKGGSTWEAIGLVASAVIVFILREWAGEESSVFSIPVRYWPPVLLVIAVLVYSGR